MPAANASQKPTAIASRCSRERIARPPTTMIASASASQVDIGPHQKSSGSARILPRARKQRTSPKFDGLKTCRPRKRITYFESSDDGGGAGEDPRAVQAPPVAVLGPGHAEDEGDAVAGQQRARRPHDHVLAEEGDPELEHRARPERDEDLRDRER